MSENSVRALLRPPQWLHDRPHVNKKIHHEVVGDRESQEYTEIRPDLGLIESNCGQILPHELALAEKGLQWKDSTHIVAMLICTISTLAATSDIGKVASTFRIDPGASIFVTGHVWWAVKHG